MKEITGRDMSLTQKETEKFSHKIELEQRSGIDISTKDAARLIAAALESSTDEEDKYIFTAQKRAHIDYNTFRPMIMPQPKNVSFWRWVKTLNKEDITKLIVKDCDYLLEKLKGYSCGLSFEDFEHITQCIEIALTRFPLYTAPLIDGTKSNYVKKYSDYDKEPEDEASFKGLTPFKGFDIKKVSNNLTKDTKLFVKAVKKALHKSDKQALADCRAWARDLGSGFYHCISYREWTEHKGLYAIQMKYDMWDEYGNRK